MTIVKALNKKQQLAFRFRVDLTMLGHGSANFRVFPHRSVNVEERQIRGKNIVALAFEPVDRSAIGSGILDGGGETLNAIAAVRGGEYLHVEITRRLGESDPQVSLDLPMQSVFEFVDEKNALGRRGHREGNVEELRQAVSHGSQRNAALTLELQQRKTSHALGLNVREALNPNVQHAQPIKNQLL